MSAMPKFDTPEIVAQFKVREVHKFGTAPTSYEALLYRKGGKGWTILRMSDGTRALFTKPPVSEAEAREVIHRYEASENVRSKEGTESVPA